MQQRFADDQRQTGIAAGHGVAYPITFASVEKQHLIRLRYRLVTPKMPHIDAAIRKYELRVGRALFRTLVPVTTLAVHVPDRNSRRFQQGSNGKFRHVSYSGVAQKSTENRRFAK